MTNYLRHQTMSPLDLAKLAKRVSANEFGVGYTHLETPNRSKSLAWARFCAMSLIREHTDYSFCEIGDWFFGGRDHTSVIHGIRRCKALREASPKFAAHYDEIRNRFEACQ